MSRTELTFAIALCLIAALLCGWLLHWAYIRLTRPPEGEDPLQAELAQTQAALTAHEAENARLTNELQERRAEAETAMDALRQARQTARDWQDAFEKLNGGSA